MAVVLTVACSGSLNTPNQPGTGGSFGGTGECGFGAGNCTGQAGTGGTGECTTGAGNCAGTAGIGGDIGGSGGDIGGTGGAIGGTGGTAPLPLCPAGSPMFGVCIVNDMDPVPIPQKPMYIATNGPVTATIVDVGTGTAPAACESARVIGARAPSTWWLQARTADGRLWTIGLNGLSLTPIVAKGDAVSLNMWWWPEAAGGFGPAFGSLEMTAADGTHLLWVGSGQPAAAGGSWFSLVPGDHLVCAPAPTAFCDIGGHDIIATVDSHTQTLPAFGGAILGSYYVVIGQYIEMVRPPNCADYFGQLFEAAIVKLPMSTDP
jgi:hypothetical protein